MQLTATLYVFVIFVHIFLASCTNKRDLEPCVNRRWHGCTGLTETQTGRLGKGKALFFFKSLFW